MDTRHPVAAQASGRRSAPLHALQVGGPARADVLVHRSANALEQVGFIVNDCQEDMAVAKVMGYEPKRYPAEFALPVRKISLRCAVLREMTRHMVVDVAILKSIMGVWIWGEVAVAILV